MIQHKVVWHDYEATAGRSSKRGYDSFDFGIATGARCDRLHVVRSGRSLEVGEVFGGAADRIRTFAKELVALQPDVIVAHGTPVTAALQRETRTIPIVFVTVSDPVGDGFVAGLPPPGREYHRLLDVRIRNYCQDA